MNISLKIPILFFLSYFLIWFNATGQTTLTMSTPTTSTVDQCSCIDVTVTNYNSILATQGSIEYDDTQLAFDYAASNFFPASAISGLNSGVVTYLYFAASSAGNTVPDGTVLFTICFNVLTANATPITFSDSPTNREIVDNAFQVLPVTYTDMTIGNPNCHFILPTVDIPTGIYPGFISVTCNSCIRNPENVTFKAGSYISLDPGFCVDLGGVFSAEID